MENERIIEIVKGLILSPTYDAAVQYIKRYKEELKTDAARDEFKKLLAHGSLSIDWAKQIEHFLEIIEQIKTANADTAVTAGMKKFTDLIAIDKNKKFNDTGIE